MKFATKNTTLLQLSAKLLLPTLLICLLIINAPAADGDLDATFDGDGKVSTDIEAVSDSANNAAQQADGKIVTVGATRSTDTDPGNLLLVRYNANGSLNTSSARAASALRLSIPVSAAINRRH